MRSVGVSARRRSSTGGLWGVALFLVVVLVGAAGTLAIIGVPAEWRFWQARGPIIAIPVNARPVAAYAAITREDLVDLKKRSMATIELPLSHAIGVSIEYYDATGGTRRSAVKAATHRDGRIELQVRDGEFVRLDHVRELGGALLQANDIIGRVVQTEKRPGYGFKEEMFLPKGTRPGVAGGVPDGMQAISLAADRLQGVHVLRPGDRVDLLATIPHEFLDRFGGSDKSRLSPGEASPGPQPPSRDKQRRGELRLLAENAQLITPVTVRGAPLKTGSLTQGAQVRTVPVQEVVLAVARDDVPGLTEALNLDVEFTCVAHSSRPAREVDTPDEIAGQVRALAAARPIALLTPLAAADLADPRTRRQARVALSTEEFSRRRAFADPSLLVGRVAARPLMPGQLITEDDLLPRGTPGGAAAGVPVGMRALVVDAERIQGLTALSAGDHFDVLGAVPWDWKAPGGQSVRVLGAGGSSTSLPALRPQAEVRLLAQDVRVITRLPSSSTATAAGRNNASAVPFVIAVATQDVTTLAESLATSMSLSVVAHSARSDATDTSRQPLSRSSKAEMKVLETMVGGKRDSVIFVPPQ